MFMINEILLVVNFLEDEIMSRILFKVWYRFLLSYFFGGIMEIFDFNSFNRWFNNCDII